MDGYWGSASIRYKYSTNTECTVVVQYSSREYSTIRGEVRRWWDGDVCPQRWWCALLRTSPHSSICFNAPVPWYLLLCATMVSWSSGGEVDGTCN